MYSRFAFALISFSVVAFGVALPTISNQCPENEVFMPCGSACAPTCKNPNPGPACTRQCVIGCFCKEGYLRNAKGVCVETRDCEKDVAEAPMAAAPVLMCNGDNEEFKQCKGCDGTCDNQHPICPRICVAGCACKKDHVRDANNRCMPVKQCPVQQQERAPENLEIVAPVVCFGENEKYSPCKPCDGTCDNPNPICPRLCRPGCSCKEGHVRDGNGRCMPLEKCPVQQQEQAPENIVAPRVCTGEHEEFQQCKRCDGTCDNPHPICPRISLRVCRSGCACKPGHVRDGSGVCVPMEKCPALKAVPFAMPPEEQKCPQNEIFRACGSACPATCANPHPSPVCTRQCVIGCFCQEGFLRNANGICVPAANCEA